MLRDMLRSATEQLQDALLLSIAVEEQPSNLNIYECGYLWAQGLHVPPPPPPPSKPRWHGAPRPFVSNSGLFPHTRTRTRTRTHAHACVLSCDDNPFRFQIPGFYDCLEVRFGHLKKVVMILDSSLSKFW